MILVTGATGLVGSHLMLDLCKKGYKVKAMCRPGSDKALVRKIFLHYSPQNETLFNGITWTEGDLNDVFSLEEALEGVEYVYHCAALVSFKKYDRDALMKINAEGTANVVNACLDAGIKKLCYVSSTAAIGKGIEHTLLTENDKWVKTPDVSNYSISKYLAEQEVWRGSEEGLKVVIVNPCVILGPHNWNLGSTFTFKNIYRGLKYYTSGSNAVVDVRTLSRVMMALMESDIAGERFLVISENLGFRELFTKIAQAMDKKPPRTRVGKGMANLGRLAEAVMAKFRGSEPRITKETMQAAFKNYSYSSEKLKKALPGIDLGNADDAIANTVDFLKKNAYIQ
jgi:nucleoside-diphosphate-sugar epimerase